MHMTTIHISAAEAACDFAAVLAQVRGGAEVVLEDGPLTVAVLCTAAPARRSIEECIALLPEDSPATIDDDFAREVAEAVAAHREPLNPGFQRAHRGRTQGQTARQALSEIAARAAGEDVAMSVVTPIELAHGECPSLPEGSGA